MSCLSCAGSYSFVGLHASSKTYDDLAKPVQRRVLFAGEHTCKVRGCAVSDKVASCAVHASATSLSYSFSLSLSMTSGTALTKYPHTGCNTVLIIWTAVAFKYMLQHIFVVYHQVLTGSSRTVLWTLEKLGALCAESACMLCCIARSIETWPGAVETCGFKRLCVYYQDLPLLNCTMSGTTGASRHSGRC